LVSPPCVAGFLFQLDPPRLSTVDSGRPGDRVMLLINEKVLTE